MSKTATGSLPQARDDYLELVKTFRLTPIKDERHLDQALGVIDRISIIDEEKLTPGQADYLYALSDLVWLYEQKHRRIDLSHLDAVEALKYLLEQRGMSASDLGRLLGNRSLGSAILRRQRGLSKDHIRRLAEHFGVTPALFLR
jgi:HTH-type transcriptional regulator / antitoxin HigA